MKQWIFLGLSLTAYSTMQLIGSESVQDEPVYQEGYRAGEAAARAEDRAEDRAEQAEDRAEDRGDLTLGGLRLEDGLPIFHQ